MPASRNNRSQLWNFKRPHAKGLQTSSSSAWHSRRRSDASTGLVVTNSRREGGAGWYPHGIPRVDARHIGTTETEAAFRSILAFHCASKVVGSRNLTFAVKATCTTLLSALLDREICFRTGHLRFWSNEVVEVELHPIDFFGAATTRPCTRPPTKATSLTKSRRVRCKYLTGRLM